MPSVTWSKNVFHGPSSGAFVFDSGNMRDLHTMHVVCNIDNIVGNHLHTIRAVANGGGGHKETKFTCLACTKEIVLVPLSESILNTILSL